MPDFNFTITEDSRVCSNNIKGQVYRIVDDEKIPYKLKDEAYRNSNGNVSISVGECLQIPDVGEYCIVYHEDCCREGIDPLLTITPVVTGLGNESNCDLLVINPKIIPEVQLETRNWATFDFRTDGGLDEAIAGFGRVNADTGALTVLYQIPAVSFEQGGAPISFAQINAVGYDEMNNEIYLFNFVQGIGSQPSEGFVQVHDPDTGALLNQIPLPGSIALTEAPLSGGVNATESRYYFGNLPNDLYYFDYNTSSFGDVEYPFIDSGLDEDWLFHPDGTFAYLSGTTIYEDSNFPSGPPVAIASFTGVDTLGALSYNDGVYTVTTANDELVSINRDGSNQTSPVSIIYDDSTYTTASFIDLAGGKVNVINARQIEERICKSFGNDDMIDYTEGGVLVELSEDEIAALEDA